MHLLVVVLFALSSLLTPTVPASTLPAPVSVAVSAVKTESGAQSSSCVAYVALGQDAIFDYQVDTKRAITVSNMLLQYGDWDIAFWTVGVSGAVTRTYVLTMTRHLTKWTKVGSLTMRRTSNWRMGAITVYYPCSGGVHFFN